MNSGKYYIDVTAPGEPKEMEFVYEGWGRYTRGTWARGRVYVLNRSDHVGPEGSIDNLSGVAKYQISTDNVNWYDYAFDWNNGMYAMTTEGTHTRYFRAVDNAENNEIKLYAEIK